MFIGTYSKISKDVGCSSATIAKIMKKLQENNFIKKVQNGLWLVNPNILMKGIIKYEYNTFCPLPQEIN